MRKYIYLQGTQLDVENLYVSADFNPPSSGDDKLVSERYAHSPSDVDAGSHDFVDVSEVM